MGRQLQLWSTVARICIHQSKSKIEEKFDGGKGLWRRVGKKLTRLYVVVCLFVPV